MIRALNVLMVMGFMVFAAAIPVHAQEMETCVDTVKLNWDTPTKKTDGDPLPQSEIDRYILFVENGENSAQIFVAAELTELELENPIPDCGAGTAAYRMVTVDTNGDAGPSTQTVSVSMGGGYQQMPARPNPGSGFTGEASRISIGELPACTQIIIENCRVVNIHTPQ